MAIIKVKFTPKQGGSEFEVRDVRAVGGLGADRTPGPNGRVGTRGFNVDTIRITREVSEREDGITKLASGLDQKAYFSGEITIASADDESNIIRIYRWEEGHISGSRADVSADDQFPMTEVLDITVQNLKQDDFEFKRVAE